MVGGWIERGEQGVFDESVLCAFWSCRLEVGYQEKWNNATGFAVRQFGFQACKYV